MILKHPTWRECQCAASWAGDFQCAASRSGGILEKHLHNLDCHSEVRISNPYITLHGLFIIFFVDSFHCILAHKSQVCFFTRNPKLRHLWEMCGELRGRVSISRLCE